jgi:hypothetical protein
LSCEKTNSGKENVTEENPIELVETQKNEDKADIFVQSYNINNLFEIDIPENIKVISIDRDLLVKSDNDQYIIRTYLEVIFQGKYFGINISCYGNTNALILNGTETYNMKITTYHPNYAGSPAIKYLKQNYIENPFINKNNVKISRFVSNWASDISSDYYGLYFTLPDSEFNECIIDIYNIWGTFGKIQELGHNDKDYKIKYMNEGGKLEEIFRGLELLEDSITFTISDNSKKVVNGFASKEIIDDPYILPTIIGLRMRARPSLDGDILGYMENSLYRIIIIGDNMEIDGIKGNWIMIRPFNGNSVSWVFSGYTRKATSDEIGDYFGG